MSDPGIAAPWLSLIGLGEDGLAGLTDASRKALEAAEFVFGGPRHLALAGIGGDRAQPWPVPFSVIPVMALRGRRVVVLASGDPFWFGAGGALMAHVKPGEWLSYPQPSIFSLAANLLGWRLENSRCLGLHAAPFARMLPGLGKGERIICTLRDGNAPAELAAWLTDQGAGDSQMHILQALGGPQQRVLTCTAQDFALAGLQALIAVGIEVSTSIGLPTTPGLPDDAFAHDGQITKRPVRALTLCALAPRRGEVLWDIGAGSGSVSVEWCLAGGHAVALEVRGDRVPNIATNIERFGLAPRMKVIEGAVTDGQLPEAMNSLPGPDAVFIGGGGTANLLCHLFDRLPKGTRLVMNGVTLETEMLLATWHAAKGGTLLRIDLAEAAPLGRMRGWSPARPVVQWSVVL
jgi:precorrin-6Y C5,15-methyltransferase (decarboxylating)